MDVVKACENLKNNVINSAIQNVQNGRYPIFKYRISLLAILVYAEEIDAIQKLLSAREYDKDFEHPNFNSAEIAVDINNYQILDVLGSYFERHKIDVPVTI